MMLYHITCQFLKKKKKNIIILKHTMKKKLCLDRDLCFQAIINILDNASYYAPRDSVFRLLGIACENYYVIKFIDQGAGVKENNINSIFNRFFREDKSRSNKGNGLGLSMSKVIICKHNGEVFAKNNSDKGLTVIIKLPFF
ncbi:MAG: ATP-binding protein [Gammaproteobacteria bacterium]|nr:MAG: ATP-binding protein [Gammaproteobacteria bacterium]